MFLLFFGIHLRIYTHMTSNYIRIEEDATCSLPEYRKARSQKNMKRSRSKAALEVARIPNLELPPVPYIPLTAAVFGQVVSYRDSHPGVSYASLARLYIVDPQQLRRRLLVHDQIMVATITTPVDPVANASIPTPSPTCAAIDPVIALSFRATGLVTTPSPCTSTTAAHSPSNEHVVNHSTATQSSESTATSTSYDVNYEYDGGVECDECESEDTIASTRSTATMAQVVVLSESAATATTEQQAPSCSPARSPAAAMMAENSRAVSTVSPAQKQWSKKKARTSQPAGADAEPLWLVNPDSEIPARAEQPASRSRLSLNKFAIALIKRMGPCSGLTCFLGKPEPYQMLNGLTFPNETCSGNLLEPNHCDLHGSR